MVSAGSGAWFLLENGNGGCSEAVWSPIPMSSLQQSLALGLVLALSLPLMAGSKTCPSCYPTGDTSLLLVLSGHIQQLPGWSPLAFWLHKGLFPPAAACESSGKGREGVGQELAQAPSSGWRCPTLTPFIQQHQGGDKALKGGFFLPWAKPEWLWPEVASGLKNPQIHFLYSWSLYFASISNLTEPQHLP